MPVWKGNKRHRGRREREREKQLIKGQVNKVKKTVVKVHVFERYTERQPVIKGMLFSEKNI